MLQPGDEVITGDDLYGGTYRLFTKIYEKFGIKFNPYYLRVFIGFFIGLVNGFRKPACISIRAAFFSKQQ